MAGPSGLQLMQGGDVQEICNKNIDKHTNKEDYVYNTNISSIDSGTSVCTAESVLLYDIDKMFVKTSCFTTQGRGSYPEKRKMSEYLKYGVIYLDKPKNPSSHEVVTWIKNILKVEKTGHGGTLDPKVSGVLTVYLNRGTRLSKIEQNAGKEYVCIVQIDGKVSEEKFKDALRFFEGRLIQRPPLISAVKRNVRMRSVYKNEFLELKEVDGVSYGLFKVSCEAGTYIRVLCEHIGLYMGIKAEMLELRRTRSGSIREEQCFTMHDVLDSHYIFENKGDERYIRRVVHPIEYSLRNYKRIMVKDSCVDALCSGAKLSLNGVIRFDRNINVGEKVVVITTKGEAVVLAETLVSGAEMQINEYGLVAHTLRVIMEKGLYKSTWGTKKFNML
ncbi:Pseudouridine synthase [Trachipleistophora hominis]|uniref:H/ACA ribonucleoprotein complex subunit CBF5 n=1 Tax=Trachipleistophora hominis TaxID=72359 RepID=L7JXR5_TRAHO|nr:Pseudouridine synthase [Trachipleistophora hominis]